MKITKVNIGMALSRNFDKVTLEMVDEPIQHEGDEDFSAGVKKRFSVIRAEIEHQFKEIQGG